MLATLEHANENQNDDLGYQEEQRHPANDLPCRDFRGAVEVGALPCSRSAVDDAVPLGRLVGKVEDVVANGEAEHPEAQSGEDEGHEERVIETVGSCVVDVERNER